MALAVGALAGSAPDAGAQAGRAGMVYRGVLTGGIWIELATDGSGRAELAVLDGLPGGAAETRFLGLTAVNTANGCILQGAEPGVQVDACPGGGAFTANVTLGRLTGQAMLQPVGWDGSFAWGADSAGLGQIRSSCSLAGLSRSPGLTGTSLAPAISALAADAAGLPSAGGVNAQALAKLRSDRLRAYSILALSPAEAARAKDVEDAIAGRPVYGRTVPLAEATRDKMAFDQQVANNPMRAQARRDLLQIDRALGEIYDPAASVRRTSALARMRSQGVPRVRQALGETLSARQPASITDLIALEGVVAELDSCIASLGVPSADSRARVRASMASRSSEIVEIIRLAMADKSSADARAVLASFEGNGAIREALRAGGQPDALDAARGRVTQIAALEERKRQDEERAARAAAARDAVPVGSSGGRFQASQVVSSIVFVANIDGGSAGSGFLVAPGLVVTNYHVVRGGTKFAVVLNGGNMRDAKPAHVVAQSPIDDIAILQVDAPLGGRPLTIFIDEPRQGSSIWVMGFPGIADDFLADKSEVTATLTEGIVSRTYTGRSATSNGQGNTQLIQHTAETAPGASGGAIIDACHRVIGVHAMGRGENDAKFNFGITGAMLHRLLQTINAKVSVSTARCGA